MIVAAVVLGVLILQSGGHSPVIALAPPTVPPNGATTTTVPHNATSTSTTVSHAGVKVLVANASTTPLVAAGYSTALQRAGWTLLPPVTARALNAKSSIYYAANKRSEADAVAAALGVPTASVLPVSPATPVSNTAGADVVVVIGSDLAAKTPPSTVPPATTTAPKTTTTVARTTTTTRTRTSTTAG